MTGRRNDPRQTTPPRLAERIARTLAKGGLLGRVDDTFVGDLEESFHDHVDQQGLRRARLWYWRQVWILAVGTTGARVGRVLMPRSLGLDVRHAVRSLRRAPGLSLAGIVTLGIGIAAPTTAFGIVDAMFKRLPVERPADVVEVDVIDRTTGRSIGATAGLLDAWKASNSGFVSLAGYDSHDAPVSGDGITPLRVEVAEVTAGAWDILGIQPILGRLFDDGASARGEAVAVLGDDLWARWFDRSPSAIGAEVRIRDRVYTVMGVAPEGFGFPHSGEIWTPIDLRPDAGRFQVVGRLSPGTSQQRAQAELDAGVLAFASEDEGFENAGTIVDEFVLSFHGANTRLLLWGLNLIVGFLVLIAAANISALFLARGTTRSAETALRQSIGASRAGVMRPLVLEAMMLAAGGAVLGIALGQVAASWFGATLDARGQVPYWADFSLRPSLILFAGSLATAATVVAGVLPALRTSRVDLAGVMKSGASGTSGGSLRLLPTLVGAEVTLACTLLILSALVVKGSVGTMQRVGAFPLERVLTASVALESFDYPDFDARGEFIDALDLELGSRIEIEDFSLATAMPGDGTRNASIVPEDRAFQEEADWPRIQRRIVDPAFFSMFSMETIEGRTFDRNDRAGTLPVAVVNEAYARQELGSAAAAGRRIWVQMEREGPSVLHEVVGQVRDPGVSVDDGQRIAAVFLPLYQQNPSAIGILLRTRSEDSRPIDAMTSAVASVDPLLPLERVMSLEAVVRRENDGGRLGGTLFGSLGLAALLLAVVGLYGVVSFTTARRTYDIGVMGALGAPRRAVIAETVKRGMRPVVAGVVLGLGAAWLTTPLLGEQLLEGMGGDPHDPLLFSAVPMVLVLGALGAVLIPAVRAARIDPARAVRVE